MKVQAIRAGLAGYVAPGWNHHPRGLFIVDR
jgi:hypothetical protein